MSPQPTVVIAKGAVTHRQTATISFNPAELYNGEYPLNGDKGPLYKGKKFKLFYDVAVKGIPGQQIDVSNSVKFGGSMEGSASAQRPVTIQIPTADAGATGSITATKVSADDNTTPLKGAEFKMCQVDTGKPVKDNGVYGGSGASGKAWPCTGTIYDMKTGANGQLTFSNGSGANNETSVFNLPQNTLFVAWETKAPEGYVVNTMPQYFYLKYLRADDADTALTAISSYADKNDIYVLDAAFSIVDPRAGFAWVKVDEKNIETVESSGKPSVSLKKAQYLAGTEWTLKSNDNRCTGDQKFIPNSNVACEVTIVDNGAQQTATTAGGQPVTYITRLADADGDDGRFKVSGLPTGSYTLTETKAPSGYESPDGISYTVTVKRDGTFEMTDATTTGSQLHALTDDDGNPTGEYAVGNDRKTAGLEWGKVDESDVETNGSSVALKEGAAYLGGSAWSLTSNACGQSDRTADRNVHPEGNGSSGRL
ncbi:Cna protein B-type domain-containing protein [Bifidobacterium criceti]|uniref:Cna protein B-type domain-containing protein n=1 Tax=Bifidobacterium criceti TaxID=1960969 RepID=A0A2A2EGE5_9BIFI|nr:Cna protein B-type domain-containing protein [Bifidobacterium criceti]